VGERFERGGRGAVAAAVREHGVSELVDDQPYRGRFDGQPLHFADVPDRRDMDKRIAACPYEADPRPVTARKHLNVFEVNGASDDASTGAVRTCPPNSLRAALRRDPRGRVGNQGGVNPFDPRWVRFDAEQGAVKGDARNT